MYEFRLIKATEIFLLQKFLKQSWKRNHIFVKSEEIIKFQHMMKECFSFVGAFDLATKELHAVIGFISPQIYFTRNISKGQHIWLAIWKVEKNKAKIKSLGLDLLKYIVNKYEPLSISAIGINNKAASLYKLLGYTISSLKQVFLINNDLDKFNIAQIKINKKNKLFKFNSSIKLSWVEWSDLSEELFADKRKPIEYFIGRYKNHPKYIYRILTFNLYKKPKIQLIVRLIKVNDSKCLRIIDGVGLECFEKKYLGILSEFISEEGLEYIDCICDPASAEIMINSGFSLNEKNKYVPHLFEPFNQKLTTVLYATTDPSIKIMKGDSDLDRPNV